MKTVGELIKELQQIPNNTKICIIEDTGFGKFEYDPSVEYNEVINIAQIVKEC